MHRNNMSQKTLNNALLVAVDKGQPEAVEGLLKLGANNQSPASNCLRVALENKNLPIFKLLMSYFDSCHFHSRTLNNVTVAQSAARTNQWAFLETYELVNTDISSDENFGECLFLAIKAGELKVAKILIKGAAISYVDPDTKQNALDVAVTKGDIAAVELLISFGDRKTLNKCLIIAVEKKQIEIAQILLQNGASNSDTDKDVLAIAIDNIDLEMFMLLMSYYHQNAFVTKRMDQMIPVQRAARLGLWFFVEAYVLLRKDDTETYSECSYLAVTYGECLYLAVQAGELAIAQLLISKNAPLTYQDPITGDTALHLAVRKDDVAATEMLVRAGASLTVENKEKKSTINTNEKSFRCITKIATLKNANNDPIGYSNALYQMAKYNQYGAAVALLNASANANIHDPISGNTSLHLAILNNNPPMVASILRSDFKFTNHKNKERLTPIDLAAHLGFWDCHKCFIDPNTKVYTSSEIKLLALRIRLINDSRAQENKSIIPNDVTTLIFNYYMKDFQGAYDLDALNRYYTTFLDKRSELVYLGNAEKFVANFEQAWLPTWRVTKESTQLYNDIKAILNSPELFFNKTRKIQKQIEHYVYKKGNVKSDTVEKLISLNLFRR